MAASAETIRRKKMKRPRPVVSASSCYPSDFLKEPSLPFGARPFREGGPDGKVEETIPAARSARQQAGWNGEGTPKPTVGPSVYWDGVIYRVLPCPSEFEVDPVGNLPIAEIRICPRRPFHGHEVHPIDTQRDL